MLKLNPALASTWISEFGFSCGAPSHLLWSWLPFFGCLASFWSTKWAQLFCVRLTPYFAFWISILDHFGTKPSQSNTCCPSCSKRGRKPSLSHRGILGSMYLLCGCDGEKRLRFRLDLQRSAETTEFGPRGPMLDPTWIQSGSGMVPKMKSLRGPHSQRRLAMRNPK